MRASRLAGWFLNGFLTGRRHSNSGGPMLAPTFLLQVSAGPAGVVQTRQGAPPQGQGRRVLGAVGTARGGAAGQYAGQCAPFFAAKMEGHALAPE